MSELTLLLLRIAFLAVLWGFVFAIVYALRSDLFGQRARRMPQPAAPAPSSAPAAPAPAPAPRSAPAPDRTGPARRLVITSGAKEGLEIDLPDEQLTIGRSGDSGLVIRDDYTSTHHARLLKWPEGWVVQDLDSTNGTFLDGQRVTVPTPVPLNTTVKIGTTTFELRR
ncbi:MAG TPA: FHA domain-containing protein [Rhodoglobus sp.]|nr:FHA domain-containing protein [Rhodoglobus sp.]